MDESYYNTHTTHTVHVYVCIKSELHILIDIVIKKSVCVV